MVELADKNVPEDEPRSANSFELISAQEFIPRALVDLSQAQESFAFQFHAFEVDYVGHAVVNGIRKARKRGLQGHFIVDHFIDLKNSNHLAVLPWVGSGFRRPLTEEIRETRKYFALMEAEGVDVQKINPLGFLDHRFLERDHKKVILADGRTPDGVAYIGGVNITDHNISWRDYMVRMKGEVVGIIQEDLDRTAAGKNDHGRSLPFSDGKVVTDQIGSPRILSDVLELIESSRETIYMESPYIWGDKVFGALADAAWRGVNVTALFPQHLGRLFVPTESEVRDLEKHGGQTYLYNGPEPMLHTRLLMVDDTTVVGSNPFNELTNGRVAEISIFSSNKDLKRQALSMFYDDLGQSRRVSAFHHNELI